MCILKIQRLQTTVRPINNEEKKHKNIVGYKIKM